MSRCRGAWIYARHVPNTGEITWRALRQLTLLMEAVGGWTYAAAPAGASMHSAQYGGAAMPPPAMQQQPQQPHAYPVLMEASQLPVSMHAWTESPAGSKRAREAHGGPSYDNASGRKKQTTTAHIPALGGAIGNGAMQLEADSVRRLPVDQCIAAAARHFANMPSRPPDSWIAAMMTRHASYPSTRREGLLSEADYDAAMDALRRC